MNDYRLTGGQILLHGILAGLVAGLALAVGETLIAGLVLNTGWDSPLRWVAAIGVGTKGLDPAYGLEHLVLPALLIHFTLSAIYGLVFAWVLSTTRQLAVPASLALLYGALYGAFLWALNFLVIARSSSYFWFTDLNQFWVGFLPHALFYGVVIGAYVAAVRPGVAEEAVG